MYIDLEKINEIPTNLLEEIYTLAGFELQDREVTMKYKRTMMNPFEDGWNYTCHPIQEGYEPHEWFEVVRSEYDKYEVKDVLAYHDPKYDALTCPASWLYNAELRPEPEWGVEVIWREHGQESK